MNPNNNRLLMTIFLCGVLSGACASLSDRRSGDNFLLEYRVYQGHVRAGDAAVNKKDYEKAIDRYSKAIDISPFVASHYYYRGLARYNKGNRDGAMDDFDKVIVLDSTWRTAYVYRGLCHEKRKEYEKALSDYKRALSLKNDDATIHNNLGWLYATANDEAFQDKAKALEHAMRAAELSKGRNAQILDTLAKAYFINGKVKEAIDAEKQALKWEPTNQEFKRNLEEYEKASSIDD